MITVTNKEAKVLAAFINNGTEVNGAENPQELIDDNMTWTNVTDLDESIVDMNVHQLNGVLSTLGRKGLIVNSGESTRGDKKRPDWYASDEGILIGWTIATPTAPAAVAPERYEAGDTVVAGDYAGFKVLEVRRGGWYYGYYPSAINDQAARADAISARFNQVHA